MKRTFLFLSVLLLLAIIYLIIMNVENYTNINYIYSNLIENRPNLVQNGGFYVQAVRVSTYTLGVLISGIFVGAGTVYMFLDAQRNKVKAYQRELEKTSISGSTNASRVEVLEAKIKTLEKAFNTVIDERTALELQIKNLNIELDKLNKDK